MIYHELLANKNFFREITRIASENDEMPMHHDFSRSTTYKTEEQVDRIIACISSHCNPFKTGEKPSRNIVTQQLTTNKCTGLLNIFENGCNLYKQFFSEIHHKMLDAESVSLSSGHLHARVSRTSHLSPRVSLPPPSPTKARRRHFAAPAGVNSTRDGRESSNIVRLQRHDDSFNKAP